MAFYYVKSGGTATGDAGRETVKRVGAFEAAANNYDSIYDVFTGAVPVTAPVAGDLVVCASDHNKLHGGENIYLEISDGVTIISADVNNQENYLAGAIEGVSGIFDLKLAATIVNTSLRTRGISFSAGDDIIIGAQLGQKVYIDDATLSLTGTRVTSEIALSSSKDGVKVYLTDVDISFNHVDQSIDLTSGFLRWDGGTLSGGLVYLFESSINNAKGAILKNLDLTTITTAISKMQSSGNNDFLDIHVKKCLLASGTVLDDTSIPSAVNICITGESLGIGASVDQYHYFKHHGYAGTVEENETVYRTLGATSDPNGVNHYSAQFESNSNISLVDRLEFDLVTTQIDITDYTSNVTFLISFALEGTTTALNKSDLYFIVNYPDGTTQALGTSTSTELEPLATDSAHTTTTSEWTIGATNVQMTESVVIPIANIGTGPISVTAYLTKDITAASHSLFIDRQVDIT